MRKSILLYAFVLSIVCLQYAIAQRQNCPRGQHWVDMSKRSYDGYCTSNDDWCKTYDYDSMSCSACNDGCTTQSDFYQGDWCVCDWGLGLEFIIIWFVCIVCLAVLLSYTLICCGVCTLCGLCTCCVLSNRRVRCRNIGNGGTYNRVVNVPQAPVIAISQAPPANPPLDNINIVNYGNNENFSGQIHPNAGYYPVN